MGGIRSPQTIFRKTVKPLVKKGLEAEFVPLFDLFLKKTPKMPYFPVGADVRRL
jgi:hypothetical protein